MKKFAKLSLVAAVAVAGFTSANAGSLEEAIKNVDISGQFRYRMEERSGDVTTHDSKTDVEVEVTAKVPVTDSVTAVFKIDYGTAQSDGDNTKGSFNLEDYYFSYVNGGLTTTFGQQNVPGRMTDGAQGDGLVALYNFGSVTVGAASFMDVTAVDANNGSDRNLNSVIAMGSIGPVSLVGQYANLDNVADAYNLKADIKAGPVMAGLEYTDLDLDSEFASANNGDRSTLKAYVSGSVSIVSAKLTYAATGDNGSGSLDNQLKQNIETPSEFLLWNLGTGFNADMDVIALDLSFALSDKLSLRTAYADGEIGNSNTNEVNEALIQVSYKVSSNLNTYIRYAQFDNDASDNEEEERARIEIKYSF